MITIQVNDAEITALLTKAVARLADTSPMMVEIADTLLASTKARFASQKGPDGSAWEPRSPVTLKRYKDQGFKFGGILHLSGQLRQNIFSQSGPDFAEIASPERYAAVMQFGAEQGQFGARMGRTKPSQKRPKSQDYFFPLPWGNIPARPFLGLSDEDRVNVVDIITEWVSGSFQP